MKKLAIAGLLAAALSLTTLSQQKAAAGGCCCGSGSGEFNLSIGFSISGCWNRQPCCSPCCGGDSYTYCPDVSAYTGGGCPGYCAASYAAPYYAPQSAPIAAPTAATGVQNAAYCYQTGYSYPSYGAGYNYGYYQAPSYWYGR
jgi:hypothetical protein